jgi:hypothetical protein
MPEQKTNRKGAVAEPAAGIDMKAAVKAAIAFLRDLIPSANDIRLEEVEPGGPGWIVVLSYIANQPTTLAIFNQEQLPRIFKKIPIDSESGTAQSLKAWK